MQIDNEGKLFAFTHKKLFFNIISFLFKALHERLLHYSAQIKSYLGKTSANTCQSTGLLMDRLIQIPLPKSRIELVLNCEQIINAFSSIYCSKNNPFIASLFITPVVHGVFIHHTCLCWAFRFGLMISKFEIATQITNEE